MIRGFVIAILLFQMHQRKICEFLFVLRLLILKTRKKKAMENIGYFKINHYTYFFNVCVLIAASYSVLSDVV